MNKKFFLIIPALLLAKIISNLKKGQSIMESINPLKTADEIAQNLLKEFEGLASSSAVRIKTLNFQGFYPDHTILHAYLDSGGVATIGWGTIHYPKGTAVKIGDFCTIGQAKQYFIHEYNLKKWDVLQKLKVPQNQNQIAALTSLTYNIGRTAFQSSTLLKMINSNSSKSEIAKEFDKWIFDAGKVVDGLVKRRKLEKQIYLS